MYKFLFTFGLIVSLCTASRAQSYVTWSPVADGGSTTGTFPGGTVTVDSDLSASGIAPDITSPAYIQTNLYVTGNKTFSTIGAQNFGTSKHLRFTFSVPVIVTRYNMSDIDLGFSWNDTFVFSGISFTSVTSTDVNATVGGATAITDSGGSTEIASWFNSTVPVTSFELDYQVTGGRTHAYLGYSLEVMIPGSTTLVATVNSPTICQGATATVSATVATPGTYDYSWTVPVGATNPGNVPSFTTTTGGVYSVIVTNPATGDSSGTVTGTVTITPRVTPAFTQIAPLCHGDPITTSLPLTSLNAITGTWAPALNNQATTTYTFTPAAGSCANPQTMTIIVNPRTDPVFAPIAPLCFNDPDFTLPLISQNNIPGTWLETFDNQASATYTFIPDPGKCANQTSLSIDVLPDFDFAISGNCTNDHFVLTASSANADLSQSSYAWQFNDSEVGTAATFDVTQWLMSAAAAGSPPYTFSLALTVSGCTKTHEFTAARVNCMIPKGISPGRDGKNDFFDLSLLNIEELEIFNRYGRRVYTKGNYVNEWTGVTDKGHELPDGTYYYVINYKDAQRARTGWVYVIREK